MAPDYSPETLADRMSAEQRLEQFEIRDPFPVIESVIILVCLSLALLIAAYAREVEAYLAWFLL